MSKATHTPERETRSCADCGDLFTTDKDSGLTQCYDCDFSEAMTDFYDNVRVNGRPIATRSES